MASDDSQSKSRAFLARLVSELGLTTLYQSPTDVKLLVLQRFVRLFAYGASTLVLVAYLQALDISKTRIGFFMTLTLVGDMCISFVLTLFADGVGRRAILLLGAALMVASGAAFALSDNFWVLLAAAVFGVISPSGKEIGPFRAIEESVLAHLTEKTRRGDVYAWYGLLGTAGTACGLIACGWAVDILAQWKGWELVEAYRMVFVAYAVLGLVKFALALMMSSNVELERSANPREENIGETAPLLGDQAPKEPPKRKWGLYSLLPKISRESRIVMLSLCLLFALDNFASGLAPL
jgi:MFS family permease